MLSFKGWNVFPSPPPPLPRDCTTTVKRNLGSRDSYLFSSLMSVKLHIRRITITSSYWTKVAIWAQFIRRNNSADLVMAHKNKDMLTEYDPESINYAVSWACSFVCALWDNSLCTPKNKTRSRSFLLFTF